MAALVLALPLVALGCKRVCRDERNCWVCRAFLSLGPGSFPSEEEGTQICPPFQADPQVGKAAVLFLFTFRLVFA